MATFRVERELISERELIERAFSDGYEYAQKEFGIGSFFRRLAKKKKVNSFGKLRKAMERGIEKGTKTGFYKGAKKGLERGIELGKEQATVKDVFKNMTTGQKAATIAAAAGVSGLAAKGGLDIANGR